MAFQSTEQRVRPFVRVDMLSSCARMRSRLLEVLYGRQENRYQELIGYRGEWQDTVA